MNKSKQIYEGEYLTDSTKECYQDIKTTYFEKINIEMPKENNKIDHTSEMVEEDECEKPISITKPQEIPRDNSSLGEDVLMHMLRQKDDMACSPP
ncbi:hypothetical protein ENUP19_0253G0018 [Entamoeba nuttalli]|uniref:Uncharacterized protein n=3 Tax=Entamoeba nuttalli TaxID=412467 RepID=K2H418_ENTNP|nr:hypothetical protein ENU1_026820 [Entamoeba nuttalli P19]EKE42268.1 hypothetical protein ENU1_026820 [Entamoeba nuttalli P19]|eukprot:XP_008855397.1 hypothetical protein ENU1_026820 [Entamoeba nuttalli P19]